MKLIYNARCKIFGNPIFQAKIVNLFDLIFKHFLQFTSIKNVFDDFFK